MRATLGAAPGDINIAASHKGPEDDWGRLETEDSGGAAQGRFSAGHKCQ